MFVNFSRNTSIKKKIFLGFAGAILGIILTSVFSIYSLYKIDSNFDKMNRLNNRVESIIKVDSFIINLKKNATIFLYTGRESVRNQVSDLLSKTEALLVALLKDAPSEADVKSLKRMIGHVKVYRETFEQAVVEYKLKNEIVNIKIPAILESLQSSALKNDVIGVEVLIYRYLSSPSGKKSKKIINKIKKLKMKTTTADQKEKVSELRTVFLRATQATRSYLYLISVVMAGEALEFEYVSDEFKEKAVLMRSKTKNSMGVQNFKIRTFLSLFIVVFVVLMFFYSWLISSGISVPLGKITRTFDKIVSGDIATAIPGQNRLDEIGTLSKAAESFRERTKRLEKSNEELTQFSYITSHDLKAPLLSIIGMTSFIKEDLESGDYEEVRENVDKISTSSHKLVSLIYDILNLSKTENVEVCPEECDLHDILESIEKKIENLIKESNVSIDYSSLRSKIVFEQKIRLEQVLENLISNAVKYSDPKKPDKKVSVLFEIKNNKTQILVKDNGLGIEKKYQKNLFGMFKRFHTNVSFGSGLGLYLVRKHLDKMGADISFKSEKGEGSEFLIKFAST